MLQSFTQEKPMPELVETNPNDNEFIRRIKRIIRHMTRFKPIDRKCMQEVEEEYEGNLRKCLSIEILMQKVLADFFYSTDPWP